VTTYPFTDAGVAMALRALGSTEPQVAANLYALGYRGVRGSNSHSPEAHYLTDVIDGADWAEVYCGTDGTYAVVTCRDRQEFSVVADLPTPVVVYIERFDFGWHPELIEEESHA
jgi:hypothetical protein